MDILSCITVQDVFYAAILAFVITLVVRKIARLKHLYDSLLDMGGARNEIQIIMERCYAMFPVEKITFRGREFKRGMMVKIVTIQNKIITGEFIGGNSRNMLCIMTNTNIVAHDLTNITEIVQIEAQPLSR